MLYVCLYLRKCLCACVCVRVYMCVCVYMAERFVRVCACPSACNCFVWAYDGVYARMCMDVRARYILSVFFVFHVIVCALYVFVLR